jgi:hypothetical protein
MEVVCNLYAENRKLATESKSIYKDKFYGRDSLSVCFIKQGICDKATKIEVYCKR